LSNFAFIQANFPSLYHDALEAEKLTFASPTAAAILCHSSLENAVNGLYDHDTSLQRPFCGESQAAFAEFIQAGNLRTDQITFINNIINCLSTNGTIDNAMLFQSPFTFTHQDGLLGVFDDAESEKVIRLVDAVNNNALVCLGIRSRRGNK